MAQIPRQISRFALLASLGIAICGCVLVMISSNANILASTYRLLMWEKRTAVVEGMLNNCFIVATKGSYARTLHQTDCSSNIDYTTPDGYRNIVSKEKFLRLSDRQDVLQHWNLKSVDLWPVSKIGQDVIIYVSPNEKTRAGHGPSYYEIENLKTSALASLVVFIASFGITILLFLAPGRKVAADNNG